MKRIYTADTRYHFQNTMENSSDASENVQMETRLENTGNAQNHGKRAQPFEDLQIVRYKWECVFNTLTMKICVKFRKKQRK